MNGDVEKGPFPARDAPLPLQSFKQLRARLSESRSCVQHSALLRRRILLRSLQANHNLHRRHDIGTKIKILHRNIGSLGEQKASRNRLEPRTQEIVPSRDQTNASTTRLMSFPSSRPILNTHRSGPNRCSGDSRMDTSTPNGSVTTNLAPSNSRY